MGTAGSRSPAPPHRDSNLVCRGYRARPLDGGLPEWRAEALPVTAFPAASDRPAGQVEQVVEDAADRGDHHREVSRARLQVNTGAWDVRG